MKKNLTIGVAGAGGDGVVAMGSLLQRIAAAEGYFSQMPRYYGAQIRGGGSAVKLGLNADSPSLPGDTLDIIVCFNWQKYFEVKQELHLGPETVVLCESEPPVEISLPKASFHIEFTEKSQQITGKTINKNLVALGLLLDIIGFPPERIKEIVEADTDLHLVKDHWDAVTAGIQLSANLDHRDLILSPPQDKTPKVILHGNASIGQAAIDAGCRAYFGYPITPAAEIMQTMQKELPRVAGVFLQAEDEIASTGLLIGAALTGAKPMTGTSGPGLDLMTEMLGLGVSAEIPMVIVNVQRCGPSTGIPSKSEQSDLNHAIYGGHGDAPRVVIAPHTVESCYRLTIESFNIAEGFQVPVILLSDQWLGQTFTAVASDSLNQTYPIVNREKPAQNETTEYHRYRLTENFISPMANIGDDGLMYRTSGLTHNQDGAPAFDAETHNTLHEKRWRKLLPLCKRNDLVLNLGNDKSKRGIITWGSTAQVIRDAISFLGIENDVKVCVLELIYPLPENVATFIRSVDTLLVVEMNYSGQLFHYLKSQTDLPKHSEVYCRPGGRPFSVKELSEPLRKLAQ